jgi:HEAT repeat protein
MRTLIFLVVISLVSGCGAPSTTEWIRQTKDADVVKRRQAIRELGLRLTDGDQIVPALTDSLGDENGFVRHDAALVLGKFGPEARDALPALTAALKDKEPRVRTAAETALKKIDPQAIRKTGGR